MNILLEQLAEACRRERFAEKKLVSDTYQDGNQLLEALAEHGEPWLNVKVVTAASLAADLVAPFFEKTGMKVLDEGDIHGLVSEIIAGMTEKDSLQYFSGLEGVEGPAGILKRAVKEMRLAGVAAADLDPGYFVDVQKGQEMKTLLALYEEKLEERKLADQAVLYREAIKLLDKGQTAEDRSIYLIPEQLEFDCLGYRFLDRLSAGRRVVLAEEPVKNLVRPGAFYFRPGAVPRPEPVSALAYLNEPAGAKNCRPPKLDLFRAYGPTCEVRELFRCLVKEKIRADRTVVCYTRGETYLPLLRNASELFEIPITYAEGLPILLTRPGKLLSGLIDWIGDNYSSVHLYRLLTGSTIKSKWSFLRASLLKRAAVGWGRERYEPHFELLEKEIEDYLKKAEQEGWDTHYSSAQRDQLIALRNLVSELLENTPVPDRDGNLDYALFVGGLATIIEKWARTADEEDRAGRESVLDLLALEAKTGLGIIDLRAALNRLRAGLKARRTGASAPKAGCLHAAPVNRVCWNHRENSFVVGLSGDLFPGSGLQDPLLLDREREKISSNLRMTAEAPLRNIYNLNRFLASRRGPVWLSYPAYDPTAGRPAFPSALILQAYRLKSGNAAADYSEMFNNFEPPAAYFPGNEKLALTEYEWWFSLVMSGQADGGIDSVADCYPGLCAGLKAEEERMGDSFTAYDGRVGVDPDKVDPRLNRARVLSASAIESLAGCPFAYFLKYILNVKPPEEPEFDRWSWLNPLQRGQLLHSIYACYLESIKSAKGAGKANAALLNRIGEQEIEAWKNLVPPPSEVVFLSEKAALLGDLQVFLKCEEKLQREGSIPEYFEMPFGRGPDEVKKRGVGLADPIEITLPRKDAIYLRGNIDRVDSLPGQGEYRIWDYKTGGKYGYLKKNYIKQGRRIQHALYSIAAEQALRQQDPQAKVVDGGYLFPTEKGEGDYYLLMQDRRNNVLEAVELMLDLLKSGTFCLADYKQDSPCTFCDYQAVCRYPKALEKMELKKDNPANSELEPWKELQKYE